MPISDAGKNIMLDAFAAQAVFVSAHTGTPTGGANEVTGGDPAYVRKAITWSAADAGELAASNQPVMDIPPSTTVAHVGLNTTDDEYGEYMGSADVDDEVFTNQGTYTVTAFTVTLTDPI